MIIPSQLLCEEWNVITLWKLLQIIIFIVFITDLLCQIINSTGEILKASNRKKISNIGLHYLKMHLCHNIYICIPYALKCKIIKLQFFYDQNVPIMIVCILILFFVLNLKVI